MTTWGDAVVTAGLPVRFETKRVNDNIVVVEFQLTRPITPDELPVIVENAPDISGPVLLVISGRGPIWLYAALIHRYMHTVAAVATFDPKLGGAIIIASHSPRYRVGQVVEIA